MHSGIKPPVLLDGFIGDRFYLFKIGYVRRHSDRLAPYQPYFIH
jgi:hypothetical protein